MDFKLKKSNLNFRVYTATATPATGNENDICIISPVPMKNWILSPDAPGGAPRNDGDVWLVYSVIGKTFNAVKNNTLEVAAVVAWQYVDGTWEHKKAKFYQDGKWVDWWDGAFYNYGDECEEITGGWTGMNLVTGSQTTGGALTRNSDNLKLTNVSGGSYGVVTNKKINVSGYSTIYIELTGYARITMANSYPCSLDDVALNFGSASNYQTKTVISQDISALDGEYFVSVQCRSTASVAMYKIWLE